MVKYLIDTDVFICFLKNQKNVVELLNNLNWENCALSVITIAETFEGLTDEKMKSLERWLEKMNIVDCDLKVVKIFADQRREMRQNGNMIDNMDLLIGSTALAYNMEIVTNNIKHFSRIRGLKIYG